MTLLYVILSVLPIIEVPNRGIFTLNVGSVVIISNLIGALVFCRAKARRALPLPIAGSLASE
jgi:hypothetical protein